MKAPAFSYLRPQQLHEVLALLETHGDEARLLAGGQTLLATLNMRLSEPALLIDMQAVSELKGLSLEGRNLRIGAMVTHTEIETSSLVAQYAPLLTAAAPHIAHRAIRNLGTFGGSIAYGDPAAEWPACLLALNGVIVVRSLRGERRIAADDFFTGLYTTELAPDEVIVACDIPVAQANQKISFSELARRHGDYAVVGLAATASLTDSILSDVRLAWIGVGSTPMRSFRAEQVLEGQSLSVQTITQAVDMLRSELAPIPDLTHSEAAKRQLAGVLLKRALSGWMPSIDTPANTPNTPLNPSAQKEPA
ncbi:xanthine dehydrogenase family protein subunit M [Polaromonas sp.]|uniref:FAD binding domain-containing protein n=1 Tax=Polaromonas sp. TaxID=1869339 RepID=UPI00286D2E0C|nr:xanthine dehydrogenase family protein subunit M [Polaromonas sp.]